MSNEIAIKLHDAFQNQEWEEVEHWAKKWLKSHPNSVHLHEKLGIAAEKQGRVLDAIRHYETCFAIVKQGLDLRNSAKNTFLKKLDILYQREHLYKESYNVCRWYVEKHPYDWDSWNRLKRAARKVGNVKLSEHAEAMAETRRGKRARTSDLMPTKSSTDDLSPQKLKVYSEELMKRLKTEQPTLHSLLAAKPLEEEE